jgi:hypothetical protein
MHASRDDLLSALTLAEPLGPIDHVRIVSDVVDDLVYHKIALFSEVSTKPHMLFLGRKGAGKSALLSEIRLGTRKKGRRGLVAHDQPYKGREYVIDVFSWEHFHQIVRNVNRLFKPDEIIDALIPPEYFVELWYQTLWDEIIHYFYNYHAYDEECRDLLAAVDSYVNVDGFFEGPARDRAKILLTSAKSAVVEFLNRRDSKLYFLFDSMENYPVRHTTFVKIIAGLFQGLTKVSDDSRRIIVSFCVPEEIESFITSTSSNLMKDLTSSYRIRWKPIDLIRIVAHRLRVSASVYDKHLFAHLKELDFSKRDDLHEVFRLVLPGHLKNYQNTDESTLAYIIRHTQLLPRHILAIFNAALSHHFKATRTFVGLSDEQLIAKQILLPFEQLYPKLLGLCRTILPDLDPICDFKTLRRAEGRFERRIEEDIGSVWHTLFEIGVIGRSTDRSGTDSHVQGQSDRYCYGQFHFNTDGAFGFATDGEFCFHPVFSRAFGLIRRSGDKRVVYPAHIDLDHIYEEA